MQPADGGSTVHDYVGTHYSANDTETEALRLCDGAHCMEEIEEQCRKNQSDFVMDWRKFSAVLDWQNVRSDPDTTAPQLRTFDRQRALRLAAPSPWPWHKDRKPYISSATFVLTQVCNHQCAYCQKRGGCREGERLSGEVWLDTFDQLLELGLQRLIVCGGEPALHPVFWPLMKRTLQSGVSVVLQTNGTLWQSDEIDRLAVLGLDDVCFELPSLDSTIYDKLTRSVGDLSKALRNLARFHDRGMYLQVKTVLIPGYVDLKDISALIHYCYHLGVNQILLAPYAFPPEMKEDLEQIFALADLASEEQPGFVIPYPGSLAHPFDASDSPGRCREVQESLVFLPDGGITFCESLALTTGQYIFGNMQTDRIRDLWYSNRVDASNGIGEHQPFCPFCTHVPYRLHRKAGRRALLESSVLSQILC